MEEQKYGRRKEDKIKQVKAEQGFLHSLYSEPVTVEKDDGRIEVEKKFSWKKTIFSSIAGLLISSLLTWGVWVTNSVYTHNTNEEVVNEQISTMQKAVGFEINERKTAINKVVADQAKDREILHKRITRLDTELTSRLNGLDTKIETARLTISEKVGDAKDSLGEKMDRQTEIMMQLLQQAYGIKIKKPPSGE